MGEFCEELGAQATLGHGIPCAGQKEDPLHKYRRNLAQSRGLPQNEVVTVRTEEFSAKEGVGA